MQNAPGSGDDSEEEGIFTEINITPLTDVFLVLLIIFMLVASSMVEAERNTATEAVKALAEKAMQVQTPWCVVDCSGVVVAAFDLVADW
jgi:biopolymer transport protein ExbD